MSGGGRDLLPADRRGLRPARAVGEPVVWEFSGYSQWRPYMWTGGISFSAWTPFTCLSINRTTSTASSFWVSREETVARTAAFSINGGALKATQVFSSGNSVRLYCTKVSRVA